MKKSGVQPYDNTHTATHFSYYLPSCYLQRWLALVCQTSTASTESTQTHLTQPTIAFVLPIHNEADYIEQKLANILMLDYPADKLSLYIFNDGSDDATLTQITHWQTKFKEQGIALHLEHEEHNSGKVVRLNSLIHLAQQSDFIAFTDASALLSIDGLQQAVMQFQSPASAL